MWNKSQRGNSSCEGELEKRRTARPVGTVRGIVQADQLDLLLLNSVIPNLHRIVEIVAPCRTRMQINASSLAHMMQVLVNEHGFYFSGELPDALGWIKA